MARREVPQALSPTVTHSGALTCDIFAAVGKVFLPGHTDWLVSFGSAQPGARPFRHGAQPCSGCGLRKAERLQALA